MHIGFALHDPHFAFWAILGYAARARAAELGAIVTAIPASDAGTQVAAIQQLVSRRVDVLIVGPIDSYELAPAAQQAIDAGIPVVAVDMEIEGCQVACTVRSDNTRGAERAAAFLIEQIGGQGAVAHLQGPPTAQTARQRSQGVHNVLDGHVAVAIVFEAAGDGTRESGARLMREALAAHPDLRAVFAANDPMALGAIDAIQAAGYAGKVLVAGYDALPDALVAMRAGKLSATVHQEPRELGRIAVEMALRAARGQPVPPLVQLDIVLITPTNLIDAALDTLYLLPGVLGDLVDSGEALAKERALLHTVIDTFPDTHVFVKDRASRFIIVNAAHLATLGAARIEDVVGKSDLDLFPAELAQQYYADEQAVMESGQALYDRVEPVVDQAGNQKWYLTTKAPLHDASGAVVGLIGMSRDITALRQAEEERAQLREAVIRIQEATLQELSTPLIPISDYVMVMPLVGALDSRRTQQILETLLHGIAASRAAVAILDITGVPVVDTHVANALIHAARSVKLLGAQVVLSGIRPEVAQTLVGLGVELSGIVTSSTLQSGIAYALRQK
ncbi:MAG: substrate-binding domain-containing protein [Roseiflexaceae bacterium]